MSPTLTLYRARCGRWPAGPGATMERIPPTDVGPSWGGMDDACESCMRSYTYCPDLDPDGLLTWMQRRPGTTWHLLIPTWKDADPSLLPKGAPNAAEAVTVARMDAPQGPQDGPGHDIAVSVKFDKATGVKGGPRLPGESDEDVQRRHGLIP